MIRRLAILSLAGCVYSQPIELPPGSDDFTSMILAITSGDALRVTAHEQPFDEAIEGWTASGEIQLAAFVYDEPLADVATGLSEGAVLDFGAGGQPIPNALIYYVRDGENDWYATNRGELRQQIEDFRMPPRPTNCPRIEATPIALECEEMGEHPYDTVVMMLPSATPGEAYVTTSRGCAFVIRGDEAIRVAAPSRPYLWLDGVQIEPGHFLVTGDDGALTDFVLTGTTVQATPSPRTKPNVQDHPLRLGSARDKLYAATFHGALWREAEDRWDPITAAPLGDSAVCFSDYAECHGQRTLVYSSDGLFVSNLRPTILRVHRDSISEERVDEASLPQGSLTTKLVTSLLNHPTHGLLAGYGALPAPILRRGSIEEGWTLFQETQMRTGILSMLAVGEGILFGGEQGDIGYVEATLDCGVSEQAQGALHHLIPLGPDTVLAGGDPRGTRGTLAVYRLMLVF